jgi:hypothetical protein
MIFRTLINDANSRGKYKSCALSNKAAWPSAELLGLDKSQYDAVQLSLTNKLALVQG